MNTSTEHKKADPMAVKQLIQLPSVQKVIHKAQRLLDIQKRLPAILGEPLSQHCQVLNIENNQLILAADSGAWATQCRFREAEIIDYLQQISQHRMLQFIVCKVRPPSTTAQEAHPHPKQQLSEQSRQLISSLAHDVTDPSLQQSLQRLCRSD